MACGKEGYGYGWQAPPASLLTSNRRVVEHGGRVPGLVSALRRFVDDDLQPVVVLANGPMPTLVGPRPR